MHRIIKDAKISASELAVAQDHFEVRLVFNMNRLPTDFSQTFKIVLKETGKSYTVYTEPFCAESLFFKRSLEAGFKESETKEVIVDEEKDEQSMQVLIAWVYCGKEILRREHKLTATDKPLISSPFQLAKLYLLADKFLMFNLKNDIVDQFKKLSYGHRFELDTVELLLTNGPIDCPLTRFVTYDLVAQYKIDGKHKNNIDELIDAETGNPWNIKLWNMMQQNHDLCLLMLRSSLCPPEQASDNTAGCKYHEHPSGFESCGAIPVSVNINVNAFSSLSVRA